MRTLLRLYYTLRPLKMRQWWFRMWQPIVKKCSWLCSVSPDDIAVAIERAPVILHDLPVPPRYDPAAKQFRFLNLSAAFPNGVDWNYSAHGTLWAYNLNYFEWLYDETLSVGDRVEAIHDYLRPSAHNQVGLQCYPTSLRIVAWTRFLLKHDIRDKPILVSLFQHVRWLFRFPEYHLDGNHLWENGMALVCAGVFFKNEKFCRKGKKILASCMREQLFEDGGHAEGSPMYHSLLLWRLMQCIEMMEVLSIENRALLALATRAAQKMLSWISAITFSDGSWPAINDSTNGIAPGTKDLLDFGLKLGLKVKRGLLQDSGYRMARVNTIELFIDAADINPPYQPGHSHADTGTFCLHIAGHPIIVDAGVSTYETDSLRKQQRSTALHNTISINGGNSSDVWRSFRVGRRAEVLGIAEGGNAIALTHNGFLNVEHKRSFVWNERGVYITDYIDCRHTFLATGRLYFPPGIEVCQEGAFLFRAGPVRIDFEHIERALIKNYEWARGFSSLESAKYLEIISTKNILVTNIHVLH